MLINYFENSKSDDVNITTIDINYIPLCVNDVSQVTQIRLHFFCDHGESWTATAEKTADVDFD